MTSTDTHACTVDDCRSGDTRLRQGMCPKHYMRWKKTGGLGRTCQHNGCGDSHHAKDLCEKHWTRLRIHGDPSIVLSGGTPGGPLKGVFGADHPQWKGDAVSYDGAHARLYRQRGQASAHTCGHCGLPAVDWAYNRQDPSELRALEGWPYSSDPAYYIPLCVPCHRRFDAKRRHSDALKTHCKHGHPFDDTNTYRTPDGRRQCRACHRMRVRRVQCQ